jgi:hypothetical protein
MERAKELQMANAGNYSPYLMRQFNTWIQFRDATQQKADRENVDMGYCLDAPEFLPAGHARAETRYVFHPTVRRG